MGKYQELISLLRTEESYDSACEALLHAPPVASKILEKHLLADPDDFVRETCAVILRNRCKARAVPSLILALRDKCSSVREEAVWSIEELSGLRPGVLVYLLNIRMSDSPGKLHKVIGHWWEANEKIIRASKDMW